MVISLVLKAISVIRGKDKQETRTTRETLLLIGLGIKSAIYSMSWTFLLIVSTELTYISHAIIFSSSSGLFVILWMNITGRKPHLYENVGCVVIVIGIVFLLLDGGQAKAGAESNVLLGDMIALASSILGFKYFSSMK